MSKFFGKVGELIHLFRWPLLIVLVLGTVFLAASVPTLKIDPSTETLLAKNTPEYRFYRDFRNHFGSDNLIAIAIETPDYWTLRNLRRTQALTELLSRDGRVDRVVSLTNALDIKHRLFGVKVEPAIAGVLEREKTVETFRQEVLANPLFQGNLVSRDGSVAALLVRLKMKPKEGDFLAGYVGDLRKLLQGFPWPGARFHVAGSPVEQYDLIDSLRRDQMVFIPVILAFLILATFFIYRNFPSVVIAMSVVLVTLVWTFGTIALTGRSLNLINSLLAPVVMIISVTNAIYLINLFSELRHHHPTVRESISLTVAHLGIPCLLTEATIAAGFLSLLLSPVPAVQSFGVFAALGAVYSYVIAMILTPMLLPLLPFQDRMKVEAERHIFNQAVIFYLEKLEFSLKWFILGGAALLLALSIFGIRSIRIDTNLVRDLPPKSPLAEATRFMDERLAGVYSLGLGAERRDGGTVGTVEALQKIDALAQFLEAQPEITKVNSLATLVKKVHQARTGSEAGFRIPDEDGVVQDYLEKMAESDNPDFWSFLSRDFRHTRLEARMKAVGTEKAQVLEDRIWDYVEKNFGSEYAVRVTGNVVLLGQMSQQLVSNQVESLGVAFFIILGLIALFFRSWKMALLAAIPNLIPIVSLYGLMGFLKIELSTPTAMISSVVLGLVVDASIQFLYRFRYEFERRQNYLQALHHTYRNIGQAMVVTTLILVFGFASSVLASFRPTLYFGLLTGVAILFSLICTLVLLPLALVLIKPFGRPSIFSSHPKQTLTPKNSSSIIAA
jgi:hypothetical protein